jgi:hypothetical protein
MMEVLLNMADMEEQHVEPPEEPVVVAEEPVTEDPAVEEPDIEQGEDRDRKPRKRARTSWVFSFFSLDHETERMICLVKDCTKTYSKNTSTSSLANHLKSFHKLTDASSEAGLIEEGRRTSLIEEGRRATLTVPGTYVSV